MLLMNSPFASKWRVAKACARCHRLKSKCVFEDPTYASCQRCYLLKVKCSVDEDPTAETNRRRSKYTKSATQVATKLEKLLEKVEDELQLLGKVLADVQPQTESKLALLLARFQGAGAQLASVSGTDQIPAATEENGLPHIPIGSNLAHQLIFTHKILPEHEARLRFDYFRKHMLIYYPIISFPQKLEDFDELLLAHPVLLVTCIFVTTVNDNGLSGHGSDARKANRTLNATLSHYVNWFLAHHIFIKAADFSFHLVISCLILSLWCVPPGKVGQFKSQIDLICSFSLSLCIDVGDVTMYDLDAVVQDDSVERNNLRAFLGLYCCCGSLGFSLPRFNLVAWSRRHELAVQRLLEPLPDEGIPSRNDRFLCYYARIIRVGQELFDFFAVNGVSMHFLSSEDKSSALGGIGVSRLEESGSLPLANITLVLKNYESTLSKILYESGFIDDKDLALKHEAPKEKYALLLTYYQLMMMTHDNLVSWCICRITGQKVPEDDSDSLVISQHVIKFGEICEKILQCFVDINAEPTTNYPTFFYYRALHALISLIRLLILVKSELLSSHLAGLSLVRFKLKDYHEKVTQIVETNLEMFDLSISQKVLLILLRIRKWVHVVGNYDRSTTDAVHIDFIQLTDMSKGQEIEKLRDPTAQPRKRMKMSNGTAETTPVSEALVLQPETSPVKAEEEQKTDFPDMRFGADPSDVNKYTNYSIQEIFKEIDEDVLRYLNPFDTNTEVLKPTSSFFNEYLGKDF